MLCATAGPGVYVSGGVVLVGLGALVAMNFRGFADWFLRLFVRNLSAEAVKRYRYMYTGVIVVGFVLLISGLVAL
jgi:hypothetical protein